MRKVLIGLSAVTVGYQGYAIYGLHHPSSNFKGGWERVREAAAAGTVVSEKKIFPPLPQDPAASPYPSPNGLFNIRVNLPHEEIRSYLETTKSDLFYMDFRNLVLDQGNLYAYIKSKVAVSLNEADITDEEGFENMLTLLKDISFRMVEMMTRHQFNQMKSHWSPQAWNDFIYRRFLGARKHEIFTLPRFPIILLEGCEEWQKLFMEDVSSDPVKAAKKDERLRELFNFLKWLYVMRHNTHVVILTDRPIDDVLMAFREWFEMNFGDTQKQRLARSEFEKAISP